MFYFKYMIHWHFIPSTVQSSILFFYIIFLRECTLSLGPIFRYVSMYSKTNRLVFLHERMRRIPVAHVLLPGFSSESKILIMYVSLGKFCTELSSDTSTSFVVLMINSGLCKIELKFCTNNSEQSDFPF